MDEKQAALTLDWLRDVIVHATLTERITIRYDLPMVMWYRLKQSILRGHVPCL